MRALKDCFTYWESELNIIKLSHMVRLPHIVQKSHVIQISDMIRFPFIMLLSHIIRHIYWGCLTWSVFLFCFICFARLCVEFQHLGYSLSVKMVPQASLPCLRQFSCLLSTLLNKVCTSHTIVSVWNISIKVRIAPDRARTWVIQNTCQLVSHPPNTTTPQVICCWGNIWERNSQLLKSCSLQVGVADFSLTFITKRGTETLSTFSLLQLKT